MNRSGNIFHVNSVNTYTFLNQFLREKIIINKCQIGFQENYGTENSLASHSRKFTENSLASHSIHRCLVVLHF